MEYKVKAASIMGSRTTRIVSSAYLASTSIGTSTLCSKFFLLLTCRKRKFFVTIQMQLSLQRKCLKSVDKELPAQSRNILLEKMQEQKLAQYCGSIFNHSVKLEVKTKTQALGKERRKAKSGVNIEVALR